MIFLNNNYCSTPDLYEEIVSKWSDAEICKFCFRFSLLLWIVSSYYSVTLCYEKNIKYYPTFCFVSQLLYALKSVLINAKISIFSNFKTNVFLSTFLFPATNVLIVIQKTNKQDELLLPFIIFIVNSLYIVFGYIVSKELKNFKNYNAITFKPTSFQFIQSFKINGQNTLYIEMDDGNVFYILADGFYSSFRSPQYFAEFGILLSFSLYITTPLFGGIYILVSTIFVMHAIHVKEKRFSKKIGAENFKYYKSVVKFGFI